MQATLFKACPAVRLRGPLVSPELAEFLTDLPVAIIRELIESGAIGSELISGTMYVSLQEVDAAVVDDDRSDSPDQEGGRTQ
jgi:hypothetical protein